MVAITERSRYVNPLKGRGQSSFFLLFFIIVFIFREVFASASLTVYLHSNHCHNTGEQIMMKTIWCLRFYDLNNAYILEIMHLIMN